MTKVANNQLTVGSLVKLSDQQTIQEQMDKKNYVSSVDAKVVEVTEYEEQNGNLRISVAKLDLENLYVITIEAADGEFYSVLAFVPDAFDVNGFPGGNRVELLDVGFHWLFNAPADENNVVVNELEFADALTNERAGEVAVFKPLHNTLYGTSSENKLFAFAHYRADREWDNTECFILEHGDLEDEAGGYITFFQGAILNDGELEVLK
jgi:hypothetical protein